MAAIQEALADREDVLLLDELAPEDQLEVIERSETGRVTRIRVGLTALTGTEFRRTLGLGIAEAITFAAAMAITKRSERDGVKFERD